MSRAIRKVVSVILSAYFESFKGLSKDIWLLSLMTLINRCGTMVIVFMTIYLTEELNWSLTQAGIAMSIFGLGSVMGSLLGGWLTDRVGYYPTMFWSLLIGGSSFFVLMQMETFISYCITVFVVSTINDSFRPASMASISAYAHPENHNRSLSLVRLAINLGFAMGVGAAGLISQYFGFKMLFIIDGVTCILAAGYLKLVMVEKVEHPKESEEKIERKSGESAYQDYLYIFFAIFILLNAIVFMQLWNTIPVYYTEVLNISKDEYGWIMLSNGLLIFIFEMPIVYFFENKFNKMTLVLVGAIMITFGFLIYNLTNIWQIAILISILMVSFGEIIAFPFSNAFALSRSKPGRRGEYMGLYTMSWSIAMIIGPTLGMRIAEVYGYTVLWYVISAIGGVACIGFYTVKYLIAKEIPTPQPVVEIRSVHVKEDDTILDDMIINERSKE